ncbi:exonuclease SbcC [Streptomyces sp. NBC_00016]|uniref:putative immunity protein n=1 Tax=Streptomyces sp. NBC_00016 TaxID=2975622 RepID=UPI003251C68A
MPTESDKIELSEHELREIAGYAARCARRTLPLFEQSLPADPRPREAVEAAEAFAGGGRRTGALRQSAWAAYRAAQDAAAPASAASPASPASPAAADAARAASHAAAAAYLHPLANAHQVKHVLGAAAHAARAEELAAGDSAAGEARPVTVGDLATVRSPAAGVGTLEWACQHAPPAVAAVLGRLPAAPPGGGRVGELMRDLDAALRA